jgi:hypothetical protein
VGVALDAVGGALAVAGAVVAALGFAGKSPSEKPASAQVSFAPVAGRGFTGARLRLEF